MIESTRISAACIGLLTALIAPASCEDWARIATETDEPAYGMRIEFVDPGSQAEAIGLKPGDYIYQIGERAMRGFVKWNRSEEEMLFFCRSGRKGTATVKPGKLGVNLVEVFRPQLAFLRGEIGTTDPRWDGPATEALAMLASDHAGALRKWEEAKAAGYPADELDAFVGVFASWRLGRPFSMREAYAAIHAEFKTMPRLYAIPLEDMAYASGQIDLLEALYQADPGSSKVSDLHLKTWKTIQAAPTPNRRLLDLAEKLHARDLISELVVLEGEDAPKWEERLGKLRSGGAFVARGGRYQMTKLRLPEGVENWHIGLSCELYDFDYHENWSSSARLAAYADAESGKRLGSRTIAEIDIHADRFIGTQISACAGHNAVDRKIRILNKSIPSKAVETEGNAKRNPDAFRIDLIRLGNEVAVYCDGVTYGHLPIDPTVPTAELHWFVSGISAKVSNFQAWSLKPDEPPTNP